MCLWHGRQYVAGYLCSHPFVLRLLGRGTLPWNSNARCMKIQDNQSMASPR